MNFVGFDLLAHILASKNVACIQPIFLEFTVNLIFFRITVHLLGWVNK